MLLHVRVDAGGHVLSADVAQSSGRDILDRAALEAVLAWTFAPATREGAAVAGETDVSILFRLDG